MTRAKLVWNFKVLYAAVNAAGAFVVEKQLSVRSPRRNCLAQSMLLLNIVLQSPADVAIVLIVPLA